MSFIEHNDNIVNLNLVEKIYKYEDSWSYSIVFIFGKYVTNKPTKHNVSSNYSYTSYESIVNTNSTSFFFETKNERDEYFNKLKGQVKTNEGN